MTLLERSIVQDQGSWQVDYRLRYEGASGIIVTPNEILAKVEGWVSNSRVSSHALPRWSSLVISGPAGPSATTEVIASADEAQRCRERGVLLVWTGDAEPPRARPPSPPPEAEPERRRVGDRRGAAERPTILSIAPARRCGSGSASSTSISSTAITIPCSASARSSCTWARRRSAIRSCRWTASNTWRSRSPPGRCRPKTAATPAITSRPPTACTSKRTSPGNQYYRFPERPVRYGTKMRLRFWYLIAAGTEGECRARVAQYKDTPTAWKVLTDGAHEEVLTTVGRWVKVERVFRTECEATTLALDFRISGGAEVGEMWIDDVSLEPVVAAPSQP